MPDILVTIPAYNEQDTIRQVIENIERVLEGRNYLIAVVSDGSTDDTRLEVKKTGAVVFPKYHGGLADTFRFEMGLVRTYKPRVVVHTDADGQYAAEDINRLLEGISEGNDLVLGNRLKGKTEHASLLKKVLNLVAACILHLWLRRDIGDATTGFRAFTPEVAQLPIRSEHTYTVEQIIRAARAGYKIKSIPISFVKRNGNSRLMRSPMHYIWQTIINARRILS